MRVPECSVKLTFHFFLIVLPFECKSTELCTDLQKLNRYWQPLLFFLCMPTTHFRNLKRSLCWWMLQLLQPYRTALKQSTRPLKMNPRAQHSMRWFCSHWKVLAKSLKTAQPWLASTRPQFFFIVRTTGVATVPQNRRMNRMSTLMCALSGQSLSEPEHRHLPQHRKNTGEKDSSDNFLNSHRDKKKNSCRKRQLELLC